jgi:hypothetical protein
MGGSSKKQTVGYKYYLGMHMALCHGPVDKVVRVQVDKRDAWVGTATGGQISIDKPELFGGTSKEGGVSGLVDIEMGAPDQAQNSYLASKLGALVPNFRGVCAAVLRQVYVGMNPYLKAWSFRAQRIHTRNGGEAQWYDYRSQIFQASYENNEEETWVENFLEGDTPYSVLDGNWTAFTVGAGKIQVWPGPVATHSVVRRRRERR